MTVCLSIIKFLSNYNILFTHTHTYTAGMLCLYVYMNKSTMSVRLSLHNNNVGSHRSHSLINDTKKRSRKARFKLFKFKFGTRKGAFIILSMSKLIF